MTAWRTVGGTGHRTQHLTLEQRYWAESEAVRVARKVRDEHGCTTIVSGLAIGWDTWWALAALDVGLKLWAHVPYMSQPSRWSDAEREVWVHLWERADETTVYGPDPTTKAAAVRLLHARNDGMLSVSDAMACLWLPSQRRGGTYSAVRKVAARGMPAIHLDPARRVVRLGLPDLNGEPK